MHRHEQLRLVVALGKTWGGVDEYTALEQVKPCTSKHPGPPSAEPGLQAVQWVRSQSVRGCVRIGICLDCHVMRQCSLRCQSVTGGPHKGRLGEQLLNAINMSPKPTVVPGPNGQAYRRAPSAHGGAVYIHPSARGLAEAHGQSGMRGVDALVGTPDPTVAGVHQSQTQSHGTVIGKGHPQPDQSVQMRAHRIQTWRRFSVIDVGIVSQSA